MVKKFGCVLMVLMFSIAVAFTINTPLQAAGQDKEQTKEKKQKKDEEDQYKYLESLTLEEL